MVRALEVEAFKFGDISDGLFDHHYGKKDRVAVAVPFVACPFLSCMAFLFRKLTASCTAKLPLAYARQHYESRFKKKQLLLVLFQHFGDTFGVYISSRLVESAKSKRSALHVMQSEFPGL